MLEKGLFGTRVHLFKKSSKDLFIFALSLERTIDEDQRREFMPTKVRVRYTRSDETWRHLRLIDERDGVLELQITPCKKPSKCRRCQAKLAHIRGKLKRFPQARLIRRRLKDRTNHFLVLETSKPVEYLRRHFGIEFS
jgi:hypothetical protein